MHNNSYPFDYQLKNTPVLNKLTYNGRTFFHSNSKSKSSSKNQLMKNQFNKQTIISEKDKKIRQAINVRYQKCKHKDYHYQTIQQSKKQQSQSSLDSVDIPQFAYLKYTHKIDLNKFHQKKIRNKSEEAQKNFHIRIKTKSNQGKYVSTGVVSQNSQRNELEKKNKQPKQSPRTPNINNFRKLISIELQKQLSTRSHIEQKKQFKLEYEEKEPSKPRLNTQFHKAKKVNLLFENQL